VKFTDGRFRHREVSARLFYLEFAKQQYGRIFDTKKPYLDDMVRQFKDGKAKGIRSLRLAVSEALDILCNVFQDEDPLLRSQGIIPVFYLVAQEAHELGKLGRLARARLAEFFENLQANRKLAEQDIASANFEWLEFDRLSQQGTNDAVSIRERVRILEEYLKIRPKAVAIQRPLDKN
jgi:hypothetical protein